MSEHEVRAAIVAEAIRKHPFRAPDPDEGIATYFAALLDHVNEVVDISTQWELRFDKRQKDWTAEEVEEFYRESQKLGGPAEMLTPGLHAYQFVKTDGHPVTDAELLALAERGLAAMVQMRRDKPTRELAPMVSVLLLNGECWTTVVGSEDRLALIKYLAQTQPVHGFILTADAWIHTVDKTFKKAERKEGLLQHVGSRDLRRVNVRTYAITKGRAVFADVWTLDPRTDPSVGADPYAEVFVTVPVPTGKPS